VIECSRHLYFFLKPQNFYFKHSFNFLVFSSPDFPVQGVNHLKFSDSRITPTFPPPQPTSPSPRHSARALNYVEVVAFRDLLWCFHWVYFVSSCELALPEHPCIFAPRPSFLDTINCRITINLHWGASGSFNRSGAHHSFLPLDFSISSFGIRLIPSCRQWEFSELSKIDAFLFNIF
jgi:hypothetical protein